MLNHVIDDSIRVQVIEEEHEWDALESNWLLLFDRSPYASPPLRFDWMRTWWRIYGPIYGRMRCSLQIITIWRESHLLGVLPLYRNLVFPVLGMRRIGFISTGEREFEEICPDYLNLLCMAGEEEICLKAISATVQQLNWDRLELLDVPGNSPLIRLNDFLENRGGWSAISRGICPIANLEGGFDRYLQRISLKSRQQARRLLREMEGSGATFELANEQNAESFFNDLVLLHQERWTAEDKPGCFASPRFTKFHKILAARWQSNKIAVLARLSIESEPLAVLYGFINGTKFDEYQTGVRKETLGSIHSPGILARLLLMKSLAGCGIERYDFLRGSQTYKTRLATEEIPMFALACWKNSKPSIIQTALLNIGKAYRKSMKFLSGNNSLQRLRNLYIQRLTLWKKGHIKVSPSCSTIKREDERLRGQVGH